MLRRVETVRGKFLRAARERAVDAFIGQQHAALQLQIGADRAQRLAQLPEMRQCGELIESGDLAGHRRWFIRRGGMGKAAKIYHRTRLILSYAPPTIAERRMNVPSRPARDNARGKRGKTAIGR